MPIWLIITLVIGGYFFIVFFLSRFFIPFMGFRQPQLTEEIPDEIRKKIAELEKQSADAKTFLESTYIFVQARWQAERMKTITHFPLVFRTDLKQIWQNPGYAHCTTINHIFSILLINSKFFKPEDIKIRHTFFNMVPH